MRLYVSGPMTGLPEHGFPAFHAAAAKLRELGHEVIDPAEETLAEYGTLDDAAKIPWEVHLRRDIALLMTCDVIVMIDGWRDSKGARLERKVARAVGLRSATLEQVLAGDLGQSKRKRKVYSCEVCGAEFTRGGGKPPKQTLCPDHEHLRTRRSPAGSPRGPRSPVTYQPPDRTGTGYEERVEKFWWFVQERHGMYVKRYIVGDPYPWTDDEVLSTRQFTNVYRELDPGTVAFRRWMEEAGVYDMDQLAFWSLAYRITNHKELLKLAGLPLRDPQSVSEWVTRLMHLEAEGHRVQPSTHRATGFQRMRAALTGAIYDLHIADLETAADVWEHLRTLYGLGEFYATQVTADVIYDPNSSWDRDSYVPLAIGSARAVAWMSLGEVPRGLVREGLIPRDLDFLYRELEASQPVVSGGRLTFVDIEHSLCEFSKYLGVTLNPDKSNGKLRVFRPDGNNL